MSSTMAALAEAVPGLAEPGRGLGEAELRDSVFVAIFVVLLSGPVPFWTPPLGGGVVFFVAVTVEGIFFVALGVFLSSM